MQAFLESFATVDEVYQECKRRGIKGVPQQCCHCIVAELLMSEFPDKYLRGSIQVLTNPTFDYDNHSNGEVDIYAGDMCVAIFILPPTLNAFAVAFDEGKYPDLVKEST